MITVSLVPRLIARSPGLLKVKPAQSQIWKPKAYFEFASSLNICPIWIMLLSEHTPTLECNNIET